MKHSNALTLDFDSYRAPEAANDEYQLKRYAIVVELPEVIEVEHVTAYLSRDELRLCGRSPSLTKSNLGDDSSLKVSNYRAIMTVELVKGDWPVKKT